MPSSHEPAPSLPRKNKSHWSKGKQKVAAISLRRAASSVSDDPRSSAYCKWRDGAMHRHLHRPRLENREAINNREKRKKQLCVSPFSDIDKGPSCISERGTEQEKKVLRSRLPRSNYHRSAAAEYRETYMYTCEGEQERRMQSNAEKEKKTESKGKWERKEYKSQDTSKAKRKQNQAKRPPPALEKKKLGIKRKGVDEVVRHIKIWLSH